ncbi:hypothetical protein BaRGS_00003714, partial [Batillaria attramentaria]
GSSVKLPPFDTDPLWPKRSLIMRRSGGICQLRLGTDTLVPIRPVDVLIGVAITALAVDRDYKSEQFRQKCRSSSMLNVGGDGDCCR